MPGSGDLSEKKELDRIASETLSEELKLQEFMDMEYGEASPYSMSMNSWSFNSSDNVSEAILSNSFFSDKSPDPGITLSVLFLVYLDGC